MSALPAPPAPLAEHLLDEFPTPESPQEREGYRIGGDREAAWAARKLAAALEELRRLEEQAEIQQDQIRSWLADACAGPQADAQFFESILLDYRRRLERDNPKIRNTYPIPGAKLAKRMGSKVVEITDEEAFVAWAIGHDHELLSIKPLKSAITKDGAGYAAASPGDDMHGWTSPVTTTDGEAVPGVTITRKPPSYSATLTNQPQENDQ